MQTLDLFGLQLANATPGAALSELLDDKRRRSAHFVNAHCVNTAAHNRSYAATLSAANYLLPDGSGISLAARMTGRRLSANLNGTDLFPALCLAAAARGLSVYLLGAAPGIAEAAGETAKRIAPDLRIAGSRDGYFSDAETGAVIEEINNSGADILLVAMGVPMQELWLDRHRNELDASLVMGVGGLFDFYSGRMKRAPKIFRKIGCEWLWRLALEPRRLGARYLIGNPLFMLRAALNAARWRRAHGAVPATLTPQGTH